MRGGWIGMARKGVAGLLVLAMLALSVAPASAWPPPVLDRSGGHHAAGADCGPSDPGAVPAALGAGQAQAPSAVIEPVPGTQERVCPGPLAALGQSGATTIPTLVGATELQGAGDTGSAEAKSLRSLTSTASGAIQGPVLYSAPGEADGKPTRVRFEIRDGKKVRVAVKGGEVING